MTKYSVLFFLLLLVLCSLLSQDMFGQLSETNSKHSSNEFIHKGKVYMNPYLSCLGNQYYLDNALYGVVLFSQGKQYESRKVAFDIYNDELILSALNQVGGVDQLMLPDGIVDSFTYEFQQFVYIDSLDAYLELLAKSGDYTILLRHRKSMELSKSQKNYEFKTLRSLLWFQDKNGIHHIRSKSEFIRLIQRSDKDELKRLIKKSRFSVRKPNILSANMFLTLLSDS